MPELTPTIVNEVLAACQAGATEAAAALSRTLETELTITLGEPGTLAQDALPDELNGPGLAVLLVVGTSGAVIAVPESTGLLPDWYAAPDATGQSKLTTLAQELGACFLPEDYFPDSYKAFRVENLAVAIKSAGLGEAAAVMPFTLGGKEDKQGKAWLIWPLSEPAGLTAASPAEQEAPAKQDAPAEQEAPAVPTAPIDPVKDLPTVKPAKAAPPIPPQRRTGKREFPLYTRSLLRVSIPVIVTLAEKKQSLDRILDMSPGQIIQFEKSCEEMLELEAGNCKIASGEAVKVGDKFGLRIRAIVPPDERFVTIGSGK